MNKRVLTIFVVVGLALAALPLLKLPAFYESFLYLVFHWVVLATSWNILSGYSGYFSFGHGAFFGLGMYTTAVLAGKFNWPFLYTLPMAALVPALFGVGLGAVVFRLRRLRGELFGLLTLAVTFVIATIILNTPIDGGPGVYLSAVPIPAIGPSPSATFYLLALAMVMLVLWVAYYIYNARLGSGLFAIHDDEDVAEVQGVPTYRFKLQALAISCAFAGVAGGVHALFVSYVTAGEVFNIVVPLYVVLMSVLGGSRHWLGPAVGATAITALSYAFTAGDSAVVGRAAIGLILIVVILFMPDGILGQLIKRFKSRRALPPLPTPVAPAVISTQGSAGEILLTIDKVSKSFSGVKALQNVSLEARRGEILGLVGPNGSGKSTMVNVISGLYKPEAGRILFQGEDLVPLPSYRAAHAGIARTYQIPRPFASLSVLENTTLAGMFGSTQLSRADAAAQAMYWLEFVGLADRARALPTELNLHQRKFLELSRALASSPRLVLLDEVLAGLTPSEINNAVTLVREIRQRGSTIIFIEHNMRAVLELCDRLIVLNHGQVIASGMPREVMNDPAVVSAYLGTPHG
ncbi:LivM ABC-type branched-chain amino acid transport system, permease component [Burkholderiaceae bacterium]